MKTKDLECARSFGFAEVWPQKMVCTVTATGLEKTKACVPQNQCFTQFSLQSLR